MGGPARGMAPSSHLVFYKCTCHGRRRNNLSFGLLKKTILLVVEVELPHQKGLKQRKILSNIFLILCCHDIHMQMVYSKLIHISLPVHRTDLFFQFKKRKNVNSIKTNVVFVQSEINPSSFLISLQALLFLIFHWTSFKFLLKA